MERASQRGGGMAMEAAVRSSFKLRNDEFVKRRKK
jgi:hypothetical protein